MEKQKAIVLLSGGLDSTTTLYTCLDDGFTPICLSFRYGQRHSKELDSAAYFTKLNNLQHHIVDIALSTFGGSSLVGDGVVPTDGIDSGIPSTYVPGRNTVFIAVALSLAEATKASAIYLGINAVDYSGYPDCRPEYIEQYQTLANLSSKAGIEGNTPKLVAPLINLTKVDIVKKALGYGINLDKTWSCYLGGEKPCGKCDSCRIRDAAIKEVLDH